MSLAFGARADAPSTILYNNPYDAAADNGSCLWTSTCAADQLASGTLAAQAFQLTSSASLTSVSFTELDLGDNAPTSVSWNIYADSLSTGLPGSLIASGASAVSSTIDLGPDLSGSFTVTQGSFSLPSVYLGSGSYDLAIQAQSSSFDDFLAQGASSTGAAQSFDGGASFTSGYGQAPYTLPSLAVSISGLPNVSAAPEPSVWALMIFGIGVVGAVLRLARRRYHPESRCSVMGAML
jgi:hypothetical protein